MADLPLIDFIPLLIIILTVVIAVFALYKYMKMEKIQSGDSVGISKRLGLRQQLNFDSHAEFMGRGQPLPGSL